MCYPKTNRTPFKRSTRSAGRSRWSATAFNDAPALAAAPVGIDVGAAGTDAAPQSAEIALMSDDLARLPDATTGARQAARVMRQKRHRVARRQGRVRHPGALGLVTLVLAVAADMGMSLLVTLNGLRLLRRHAAAPAAASLTCADDSCSHA